MIVGELTHDHEIVQNVRYESLWDDLGMSDIKAVNHTDALQLTVLCLPISACRASLAAFS